MWNLIIILLINILILSAYSQTHDFFKNLKISVNDSIFSVDSTYSNEIIKEANDDKINYTISGVVFNNHIALTRIKIPQTFDLNGVIQQCILYYYLLENESDRKREVLEIYPYFESTKQKPWITVTYKDSGILYVRFLRWKTIPVPAYPSAVEAEIYNQVIDLSYNQSGVFDTIDVKIFQEIAENNDLDISVVQHIYKKVFLWQKSQ